MQSLAKDTELPRRSRETAPVVDLSFLTVFMKEVVYAITQRMLELAVVKEMKLQVCLSVCQLTPIHENQYKMHSIHQVQSIDITNNLKKNLLQVIQSCIYITIV